MKIAVYTSVIGGFDTVKEPINYLNCEEIKYYCFSDRNQYNNKIYTIIKSENFTGDFSKSSKFFKIIGHNYFSDFDYAIYHDGNIQMDHSRLDELAKSSENFFLSNFIHPHRNCFYDEAIACINRDKDNYLAILSQVFSYFSMGMPKDIGMRENGILVINKKIKDFGFFEYWWNEVKRKSKRDQLSFPFVLNKLEMKIGVLKGSGSDNIYSIYHRHNNFYEKKKNSILVKIKKKIIIQIINFLKKII